MTRYVMSRFRRIEWRKCPAPIPYPSPSPPVAITVRSGFASFAPDATGSARPWIPWNPNVDRNPGRFEEHPIPLTIRICHGGSWRSCNAFVSALSTAKSPPPGHQSGFVSDLYCWISTAMSHHLERAGHDLAGLKRLPVVLREHLVELVSRLGAKQAGELPRVVPLHAQRPLHLLEDLLRLLHLERVEVEELEGVDLVPSCGHPDDRLSDRHRRGAPGHDREVRMGCPPELRRLQVVPDPLELAHPLLHHPPTFLDPLRDPCEHVADEDALLHVLVGRGDVLVPLHPRERARGDAVLREPVSQVALPVATPVREEAAEDRDVEVERVPFHRAEPLAEVQVRKDDHGGLVHLREIERAHDCVEALRGVPGCEDRAGPVPLTGAEREVQVALFRLRREAGARARALDEAAHDRRLR